MIDNRPGGHHGRRARKVIKMVTPRPEQVARLRNQRAVTRELSARAGTSYSRTDHQAYRRADAVYGAIYRNSSPEEIDASLD